MVLLLVLVVVALLASLLTEFAFSTLVDLRLTETFRDSTRAYYLAKGGTRVGRILLQEDGNGYDADDELWAQGVTSYPVGEEGVISIRIEDLGGRLDLNHLFNRTSNSPDPDFKKRFLRLFNTLGLDDPPGLIAALIDWLDEDDGVYSDPDDPGATQGAEDAYYQRLARPYTAKNGPLDTVGELAMVRGFTAEVIDMIEPHVTVHGAAKVNVNTATAEVLMSLSEEPEIDRETAEAIIEMRQDSPFRSVDQLQKLNTLAGMETLLRTPFGIKSDTYHIASQAAVNDGTREVVAVVQKTGNKLLYMKVD